jgi:hypothetical protein
MARVFGPLAALASALAHSCEEQVAQVAWLERSAEVACVVLEQLDFLKLLWFCEELVASRAHLEHAGGVVSLEAGAWAVLCVEFWVGLGCDCWEVFLGSVRRTESAVVKSSTSSVVCLFCHHHLRHRRHRQIRMETAPTRTKKTY